MAQTNLVTIEVIREGIKQFIIDSFLFGNDEDFVSNDDSFLEKGIIDSTGVLELIEFLEEKYSLKAEDDELVPDNFDSLNKVSAYVMKKLFPS